MSNEVEYDPFEYAKELEAGADLGRGDFEERREPSGLTRGELLKRGAVGVAAVTGAGAMAGTAAAEPTPEEAKGAITGYLAYFGTYTVDEQARTVTHHRKANINPGQVGDDVVRAYVFESNDRLVLTPAGSTNKIVWERAR